MSLSDTLFMMKSSFADKNIKQYAVIKIITIINKCCLIEDIKTLNREWVMDYNIYPLNNHNLGGYWEYSQYFQNIARQQKLI